MRAPKSFRRSAAPGFTLVEILVSLAILSLILLVLASITAQTQTLWSNTNSKISQFRSARNGFDTLTQRVAQATLDTYLTYSNGNLNDTFFNTPSFAPTSYVRRSDLRFLSGLTTGTLTGVSGTSPAANPTHSVFFLAPLGYSTTSGYEALKQVLNVCGYYLQFGPDTSLPTFFTSATGYQPRYRFRLMELLEPSENNSIYKYTVGPPTGATAPQWIADAFNGNPVPVHILAENIIALIILPQLGQEQKDASGNSFPTYALAPQYGYDSSVPGQGSSGADAGALDSNAQLPPLVQVTMVAIDEPSAIRIQNQSGSKPPDFGINSANLFQNAMNYTADLDQLQANLQQSSFTDSGTGTVYNPNTGLSLPKKINYHVFTTTVSIKGAQWSTSQTN